MKAQAKEKKQCVNCTCATTGFCPRGVGVNIVKDAAAEAPVKPVRPNQALREQLQKLPGNRRKLRY